MGKIISRHPVWCGAITNLVVPQNSKILSVEPNNGLIHLYTLVDEDEKKKEQYEFLVCETGDSLDDYIDAYKYLGPVRLHGDKPSCHVFYKKIFHDVSTILKTSSRKS